MSQSPTPRLTAELKAFRAAGLPTLFGHSSQNASKSDGSAGESAASRVSFFSGCVCVCVSVCGGVSETFRSCFLKRFTLSVETSDLNCLLAQLCGAKPVSVLSIRPAITSFVRYSADLTGFTRRLSAMISFEGNWPEFFDAMQRNATQIQRIASGNSRIFGSFITSSSRRNHRLIRCVPSRQRAAPLRAPACSLRSAAWCVSSGYRCRAWRRSSACRRHAPVIPGHDPI